MSQKDSYHHTMLLTSFSEFFTNAVDRTLCHALWAVWNYYRLLAGLPSHLACSYHQLQNINIK